MTDFVAAKLVGSAAAQVRGIGRPPNKRVMFVGDSRIFQSIYTDANSLQFAAIGVPAWLRFLTGQRFDFTPNNVHAVAGYTSAQVLGLLQAALPTDDAGTVFILASTNDRRDGLTAATSIANLAAMRDAALEAGRVVVFFAELPRSDAVYTGTNVRLSGANLYNHMIVRKWLLDQASTPGVYVADAWPAMGLPSSIYAEAVVGQLRDGLHQAPVGALNMALAAKPIVEQLFPPRNILPVDMTDLWHINLNQGGCLNNNPMMIGTGGAIGNGGSGQLADDYSSNITGSGLTFAYSKVMSGGLDWQQVVLGGTAPAGTSNSGIVRAAIGAAKIAVGDKLTAVAQVEWSGLSGVSEVSLRILENDTQKYVSDLGGSGEASPASGNGVMQAPQMTLTSAAAVRLEVFVRYIPGAVVAGTIRVRAMTVRKAIS
jgi:hypothetical protein